MNQRHQNDRFERFAGEEGFRRAIRRKIDTDIVIGLRPSAVASLFLVGMFLIVTKFYEAHPELSIAAGTAVVLLVGLRYATTFAYARMPEQHLDKWRIIHYGVIGLVGLYWGWLCLTVAQLNGLNWVSLFLLFLTSGLCSAAATSFSPQKHLSAAFVCCILIPIIIWCFVDASSETIAMGIVIVHYLATIIVISWIQNRRYVESFAKGFALEQLTNELESRVEARTAELAKTNAVLRESEQRYNTLFSGISDMVLVQFLPQPGNAEHFVDVNEVACRLLEYSRQELMRMTLADLNTNHTPMDPGQVLSRFDKEEPLSFEQNWQTGRGREISVEVQAHLFEYNNQGAVFYAARDVTERKKTREMMIQTEKMMSVGGLAAGMAHEVNNPLAGILQNAQVLRNRLTEPLPANLKAAEKAGIPFESLSAYMQERKIPFMLEAIVASARRAGEIVSNMLSFSRKSGSEFVKEDLRILMDQTLDIARNDYNLKKKFDFINIAIERDYPDDLPSVACKSGEIQQVFFNIISNGSHAMAGQGEATPPQFNIRIFEDEDTVCTEIRDNGPGMEESVMQRVFEPFFSTKAPGKGTGLGLYVSHTIIKNNHHGTLMIDTAPGQGTCFRINLPFEQPDQSDAVQADAKSPGE